MTRSTVSPSRSTEKDDSFCLALASRVVVAVMVSSDR